jgi:DNA-binding response OmpR family regulator
MTRILIVEDEQHLAEGLRFNLEAECYDAEVVETGEAALQRLDEPEPEVDLMVLDVMLPGLTGFDVAARLRQQGRYLPILMLTARGRADDIVKGFEAGADDYLPKPFELSVLIARINALLRRHTWGQHRRPVPVAAPAPADRYEFAGRVIDFAALALHRGGRTTPLTLMEANLLRYLVQREGQVVSRKDILEQVWGVHEDTDTRAIDNFIVRLRRHLEDDAASPRHLLTVRSVGYRFVAGVEARGEQGSAGA